MVRRRRRPVVVEKTSLVGFAAGGAWGEGGGGGNELVRLPILTALPRLHVRLSSVRITRSARTHIRGQQTHAKLVYFWIFISTVNTGFHSTYFSDFAPSNTERTLIRFDIYLFLSIYFFLDRHSLLIGKSRCSSHEKSPSVFTVHEKRISRAYYIFCILPQ